MSRLCLSIIIMLCLLVPAMESRGDELMNECRGKCLDKIDIDECIKEELLFWNHITTREAIKTCKVLIRNEHADCMGECKNAKSNIKR